MLSPGASGWTPPHNANGDTPETAARRGQLDAVARTLYPEHVHGDVVAKSLRGFPRGVACFNAKRQFVGVTAAERLLSPAGNATARAMAVRKAKGAAPLVAVYDASGTLLGLAEPDNVVSLAKGESYSFDASGTLVGVVDAAGKLRPVAPVTAKPASTPTSPVSPAVATVPPAAPQPVAKATRRLGSSSESMLRQLAHGRSAATLVRKGLAPADELLTGALVYANLAEPQRRAWEACLGALPQADREATAGKVRKQLGTSPGTERLLWALGRTGRRGQELRIRSNSPSSRR